MNKQKHYLLFCPGPVNVASNIWQTMAQTIGHREAEFSELLNSINDKLLQIYEVKNTKKYFPVVITGSGTAANESVLSSLGNKRILIITNGEFGERLVAISKLHNKHTHKISFGWGEEIVIAKVEEYLKKHAIDVIAMVHHETSTGMLNPVAKIGKLAKQYKKQFFVDTVSSAVAEKVDLENWHITFCSTSSGKAISALPGLGMIIGERKAFEQLPQQPDRVMYLNLAKLYQYAVSSQQTPNTPAVHLFYALDQSLTNILSVGLPQWRKILQERAFFLRQEMQKLDLHFLIDEQIMSSVLTTVILPDHISAEDLKQRLRDKRIIIYSGKGPLLGKVFQVGNIGELTKHDLLYFMNALKQVLAFTSTRAYNMPKSLSFDLGSMLSVPHARERVKRS